jgi:hypothetical protein
MRRVAPLLAALCLAGCGSSTAGTAGTAGSGAGSGSSDPSVPHARPQAIEPVAGEGAGASGGAPVGDIHAHAPPISEVRHLLRLELVAAPVSNATYVDPLSYVTQWERTDQGVDATMPIGAPILAPGPVKILAIIPDWYAGQPLVYFELLNGPDAGRVQYVAEQITQIARAGTYVERGQPIARYAKSGTAIEYGWSTPNGTTLAVATTGYEEGEVTPAGRAMRQWLNGLGANAGPS